MAAQVLDLGVGDVHVPGAAHAETKHTMVDLTTEERDKLPASKFADPVNRAFPIHNKAHADNAAARIEQEKGSMSPGKYARVKSRIKKAQARFGEDGKPKPQRRGRVLTMQITHPGGTTIHVRHMADVDPDGVLLLPALPLVED